MKSADDDWEELRLSTFCDASFGTRCFGGYKVKLTGSRGSSFLIEWASRLQVPQSTISTESGSIECGRAARAMLRVKGALDACRLKPVSCYGYVDNDALRLAVQRGSSAKLGHLRVHAGTCFFFLAQHLVMKSIIKTLQEKWQEVQTEIRTQRNWHQHEKDRITRMIFADNCFIFAEKREQILNNAQAILAQGYGSRACEPLICMFA